SSEPKGLDQGLVSTHKAAADGLALCERSRGIPAIERDLYYEIAGNILEPQGAIRDLHLGLPRRLQSATSDDAKVATAENLRTHSRPAQPTHELSKHVEPLAFSVAPALSSTSIPAPRQRHSGQAPRNDGRRYFLLVKSSGCVVL